MIRTRIKVEIKRNGEKTYYPQVFSSENIYESFILSVLALPVKVGIGLIALFCGEFFWYRHFRWYNITKKGYSNDFFLSFPAEDYFSTHSLEEAQTFLQQYANKRQKEKQDKLDEEERKKQEQIVKREYIRSQKVIKTKYIKS